MPADVVQWLAAMRNRDTGQSVGMWQGGQYDLLATGLYDGDIATAVNMHSNDKCAMSHWLHVRNPNGWGRSGSKRGNPNHEDWSELKAKYGAGFVKRIQRMNDDGMPLHKIANYAEDHIRKHHGSGKG
jgi:hypothetical protein